MRIGLLLGFSCMVGTLWGQIDTRISVPQQVSAPTSSSKWTGARLTGFLSEELGSTLKEGLETTFAVSGAETNQLPSYSYDELCRITGTASLHRDWSRASLLMQYVGGSDMYMKNSYLNTQFHQLSAAEAIRWSRWNFSLNEGFSYLPQSSFGFDPSHGIGNGLGSGVGDGESNLFLPPNVIERMTSTQISAEYVMGARSSLTFTGAFSDLHYSGAASGAALVDSQMFSSGSQYTYSLNRDSKVGAGYEFIQSRSLGFNSLLQAHSVTGSYSRKVGRRLRIQAAAGPQFTTLNQFGVETTIGTSVSINASASYQFVRGNVGISYVRSVNGGSGLFLGSRANDVRASVDRQFGRTLRASVSAGHGQSDSLGQANINAARQINSTYVAATIERNFGRMFSGFVTYSMQNQDTDAGLCNASGCTSFPMTHTGLIGLRFHIHPLTLRP